MDRRDYVTRNEAAQIAGVHFNTIRLWEDSGRIHPRRVKRGKRDAILISLAELQSVMDERAASSGLLPQEQASKLREQIARLEAEREMLVKQLEEAKAERERLLDRLMR